LAVATIGNSVPDAIGALRRELKELKEISETSYRTGQSGMVSGFPKSIQDETNIETLIKMHSSVAGREDAYNKSQARLSTVAGGPITAPPFKDNGQSLDNIENDIALRIRVLNITDRKKQLEDLLKEGEGFLTKEDQFKMYQQKLTNALGLQPAEDVEDAEEA
jgi:hypothetical protein